MGIFADWQAAYAARGIATFPVEIHEGRKVPAVSNYMRMGLPASGDLARRFTSADTFGFVLGRKSRIAVLDVDSGDEKELADALRRHGSTPLIVRSGGGHFQGWYRHNGEGRHVRPYADEKIDILGGGVIIAPPSKGARRAYEIIQGSLDDLERLPTLAALDPPAPRANRKVSGVGIGQRNNSLWRSCMNAAHRCSDLEALITIARAENANYVPPLPDAEVLRVACSAWGYTERGENRFGMTGAWLPTNVALSMAPDAHLCALVVFLKAENGPDAEFWIADGLAETLGWSRREFANARKRAVEQGIVRVVRRRAPGRPTLYAWAKTCQNW